MREAAIAPHLINNAYPTNPTGQAFSSDIDHRAEHYLSSFLHTDPLPSDSARGMAIHLTVRPSSRAYHQAEIQQLSDLPTYHMRYRWRDDVFSLADKAVSLQGIYRQSGHVMRSVSQAPLPSTDIHETCSAILQPRPRTLSTSSKLLCRTAWCSAWPPSGTLQSRVVR
jgi:hypothetical protein